MALGMAVPTGLTTRAPHPPNYSYRKKASLARVKPLSYRRFATAAEAIRFAVEDFAAIRTTGTWMRVGDEHFAGDDIRRRYESNGYPRRRRTQKSG